MKKKLSLLFSSLALLLVMAFALCSCSTYGSIKRKFESEGWKEDSSLVESQQTLLKNALGEDYKNACTIHALKKTAPL